MPTKKYKKIKNLFSAVCKWWKFICRSLEPVFFFFLTSLFNLYACVCVVCSTVKYEQKIMFFKIYWITKQHTANVHTVNSRVSVYLNNGCLYFLQQETHTLNIYITPDSLTPYLVKWFAGKLFHAKSFSQTKPNTEMVKSKRKVFFRKAWEIKAAL